MSDYHEPYSELAGQQREMHRALSSLKEEIEAVDWYAQRASVCERPQLRRLIEHNRDEEIEHACMLLEWLRRNSPVWEAKLRQFLLQQGDVVTEGGNESPSPPEPKVDEHDTSLGLGNLGAIGGDSRASSAYPPEERPSGGDREARPW